VSLEKKAKSKKLLSIEHPFLDSLSGSIKALFESYVMIFESIVVE